MYAVVKTGGKQYRVGPGDTVEVEKLSVEPGETVELNRVLLISDEDGLQIGRPTVGGAKIQATVLDQVKGDKITVFKFRPKNRYQRKIGHRQRYTRLRIDEIIS